MEVGASIVDVKEMGEGKDEAEAKVDGLHNRADEISADIDRLEQMLNEVEQFYARASKIQPISTGGSIIQEKDMEKLRASINKQKQDVARREAAAAKRMQKLLGQLSTALHQICQDEWADPFMHPVDVEALGLHDYYEVIGKPMDITTINNKLESKDGDCYKNVRDLYADVRLVFHNAMKYNDKESDVYEMAEALWGKFEEKWLRLLPKVIEEEKRQQQEEAEVDLDIQLTLEATHAKMARDISHELCEVDMHLKNLREMVLQNSRKMSSQEKRKLGAALMQLSHENLNKALQIVAQNNPSFRVTGEEVDLDIDAQAESTLWSLKFFVKNALEVQAKNSGSLGGNKDNNNLENNHTKRKKEFNDHLVKTSNKRRKALPS